MSLRLGSVRADFAAGFGLLTRLPVGWLVPVGAPYRPGRAVWTYPLAGLLIGGAVALVRAAGTRLGLPPLPAAAWAVAAGVLLTGGLHEDGLADTADGFGGGRTPERRLEIMRDSRIGSYGALALLLALTIRVSAIAALAPASATACLLATGALSRGAMLPVLALLRPARPDGLGQGLGRIPLPAILVAGAIVLAVAVLALPPIRAGLALALAAASGLVVARLAQSRVGGQTGDVLGASCVGAECVLLTLLAIR